MRLRDIALMAPGFAIAFFLVSLQFIIAGYSQALFVVHILCYLLIWVATFSSKNRIRIFLLCSIFSLLAAISPIDLFVESPLDITLLVTRFIFYLVIIALNRSLYYYLLNK